ncbi:MAG: replicative DNA helicase [Candidatus Marinimicrobia bacterium]|jgi:replicative DNA helicase|nr:replicative DNA helicase [Candidatus Neomarinimicrobiota bacterium]
MANIKKNEGLNLQPQALEAEEAVLGSMMIDEDAANKAISILGSSHYFYKDSHRKIFDAMLELMNNSNPIDTVSVSDELKKVKSLKSVGGIYYLTGLVDKVPTSARVETYAEIVKEKGMLRDLITTSHEISKKALDAGDSVGSILDDAEQSIFNLTEQKDSKIYQHIEPILSSTVKRIEEIAANPGSTIGVPSGIIDLDKLTAGFQKGDLIIIAGRPSMGKTALALTVARNAAIESKSPTAIFSLEMSSDQLGQRLLTSEARVDNSHVRRGSLPSGKWKNINIASGKLAQAPLYIDDTPALSILDLRSRARRLKRERNIELIIVDYLQLMQGPKNSENRQNEISQITQSLKALAKELNIPVIALSQLSRAVEQRTKKEPMLSDLRESGAIEQDADVVVFLYRPSVYEKENQDLKGLAYLIVAKQRNGPTGRVTATFIDTYARFDNYTEF